MLKQAGSVEINIARNASNELKKQAWAVYQESFGASGSAVQNQKCYDSEADFQEDIECEGNLKVCAWSNGRLVGLLLMLGRLEDAKRAYIDPEGIRARFPNLESGQFRYVPALFVKPGAQEGGIASTMVREYLLWKVENEPFSLIGIDFSVQKNPKLVELLMSVQQHLLKQGLMRKEHAMSFSIMDMQVYGVFSTGGGAINVEMASVNRKPW